MLRKFREWICGWRGRHQDGTPVYVEYGTGGHPRYAVWCAICRREREVVDADWGIR